MFVMRLAKYIFKTVANLKTKVVFHWTLISKISFLVDKSTSMDIIFLINSNQKNIGFSQDAHTTDS